jgi:hypothetical protein
VKTKTKPAIISLEQVAKLVGITPTYLAKAIFVHVHDPEGYADWQAGRVSLTAAFLNSANKVGSDEII